MRGRFVLTAILFATAAPIGHAADEISVANAPPVVVQTDPSAGTTDVDPALREIRVTFSKPMQQGGWSWLQISPASFPNLAGQPSFQADQRTAVLPVALEPGKTYLILLNDPPSENFRDQGGRKALRYVLAFSTAAGRAVPR